MWIVKKKVINLKMTDNGHSLIPKIFMTKMVAFFESLKLLLNL